MNFDFAKHLGVFAAFLFFLSTSGARAELPVRDILSVSPVGDFVGVWDYYTGTPDYFTNFNSCIAKGTHPDRCHAVMVYCSINDLPLGGVAGQFIDQFQLTQLFKIDCGNGACYACCFVPGSGCHSAFHSEDGSTVINCNAGYGPGTAQVGRTLVTDPNAQPGQACLFTPQTCDHIGTCSSARTPQQIEAINGNPNHIIKSSPAIDSRARSFGTGVLADWSKFLTGYHTSSAEPSDVIRQAVHPLSSLSSFITGRGCAGWRHNLPESFPGDWSEPQFRIDDENGNYDAEASHYNGVRQLGLVRLMSSVPNLFNRLAFVESRIWTAAAIDQYLAAVGDPDEALLQFMSPVALEVLKKNKFVQDYRLLAVPLPGEVVPERLFNGCLLADPPALEFQYQPRGPLGIDLEIEAADSAVSSAHEVGVLVLWGDGGVTRLTIPPGGGLQTVSHDYAAGGKYQVLAVAQNEAGLRAIGALAIDTAGLGTDPGNAPVPILSEIQLVDLQAEIDSSGGNTLMMMFELETWPAADQGYALGLSRALPMPVDKLVHFGTVAGWNLQAVPVQGVTIRPYRFGEGYLNGFRGVYFTLDRVRVGVYSTQDDRLRFHDVPVTPQMIRLYPSGGGAPVLLTQPTYGPDGRLKIPVQIGSTRYVRIDLVFPESLFAQAAQGPVTDGDWTGVVGTLLEVMPDDGFQAAPPPPLDFHTLPPCRLVDTRIQGGPLQPGPDRFFSLTGACGVPGDAKALALNVTVLQSAAAGHLRLYPGQGPLPTASTISFSAGLTRANNTIMALANDGTGTIKVHLDSAGLAHLVLDVNGYFK